MNPLIEIAKAEGGRSKGANEVTKEKVGLVVALLRGEVTVRGAAKALGEANKKGDPGQVTHLVPHILRVGLEKGWIEINEIDL